MSVSGGTESGVTEFGFTLGASHTQSVWSDARHVSWPRLVEMLTSHVPGVKDGPCIVPAIFNGTERKKEQAAQIDVAFLDSDSGATLDEIVTALKARGWEAVVSSTHSHMTTHTEVSQTNWDRFFAKHPNTSASDFLQQDKGYLASVAVGATVRETTAERVHIEHAPCPKFRIAIPLARPWRAADYPSQTRANETWKERIEALAASLNLWHDQACTDTSRLFYLPRRPPHGAAPETAVVSGDCCDIFSLESAAAPDLLAQPARGKTNGASHPMTDGRQEYSDPITGQILNLTDWAREYGRDFLIVKALAARRPGTLTGLIVDNTKVHIRCPNEGAHTIQGQDSATFAVNAGHDMTKGFVIHCRHAHCTGQDRLFFIGKMLSERWLSIEDLTAPEFHIPQAEEEAPDWPDDPNYLLSAAIDQPKHRAPEPSPIGEPPRVFNPWNTLRPVSFPMEALPDALAAFVENRARVIGADPCAVAWSCISACSAAIDGRVRLQMKRRDRWLIPPAIWLALVGLPSTKKSPIIDAAWGPLSKAQGRDMRAFQITMATWRATPKKERGEEPQMARRLISHDATMEALQDILSKQDRGIGVLRDELAGWIGSLEKYAPGKGGAADRAFALQSYNGGNHVVDRVMRGMVPINNLLTTVCGGIQPDRLRQFGDLTDDGLWQRFVAIIVAPAGMGEDETDNRTDDYDGVIERLLSVQPGVVLQLCEGAHAIREAVQRRVFELEQSEALGTRFVGFCGKLAGLWGRIALVLHLASGDRSELVSVPTATAAQLLLFRSALPNAARIYTAMGGAGGDVEATQSIAGYILTKRLERIVMSDLTSNVRVCRHKSAEDVRKLISPLLAGGWLLPEKEFDPTAWMVVPQVHVQFAEQAGKEMRRRAAVRALITGKDDDDVG